MKNLKIDCCTYLHLSPTGEYFYFIKRQVNQSNRTDFDLYRFNIVDNIINFLMPIKLRSYVSDIIIWNDYLLISDLYGVMYKIDTNTLQQEYFIDDKITFVQIQGQVGYFQTNENECGIIDINLQRVLYKLSNEKRHVLIDTYIASSESSQIELRKIESGELLWRLDISSLGYYLSQGEQYKEAVDTILGVSSSDELVLVTKGEQLVFISCQTGLITHIINKSLGVLLTKGVFDTTNRYLHFLHLRHYVQIDTQSKKVIKHYEVDFKGLEVYNFTMTGSLIAFTAYYPGRMLAGNVVGVYNTEKCKTAWLYEVQLAKRVSFIVNKYKPVYHEGRVLVIDSDDTLHIISP